MLHRPALARPAPVASRGLLAPVGVHLPAAPFSACPCTSSRPTSTSSSTSGTSSRPAVRCRAVGPATEAGMRKYGWQIAPADEAAEPAQGASAGPPRATSTRKQRLLKELPVDQIVRPLGRTRANDSEKVEALCASIQEVGLQEPIDVLEVEGRYYGFSGCHRYEAHVRLGKPTIRAWVRKATPQTLKMHMI